MGCKDLIDSDRNFLGRVCIRHSELSTIRHQEWITEGVKVCWDFSEDPRTHTPAEFLVPSGIAFDFLMFDSRKADSSLGLRLSQLLLIVDWVKARLDEEPGMGQRVLMFPCHSIESSLLVIVDDRETVRGVNGAQIYRGHEEVHPSSREEWLIHGYDVDGLPYGNSVTIKLGTSEVKELIAFLEHEYHSISEEIDKYLAMNP